MLLGNKFQETENKISDIKFEIQSLDLTKQKLQEELKNKTKENKDLWYLIIFG